MGMALAMHTISDQNIVKVLADPPLIWRAIAPDDPEIYRQTQAKMQPGFFARIFGAKSNSVETALPILQTVHGEGRETDIDKAWHCIHYLLTGTAVAGARPLDFLVAGGTEVGDIDVGFGPARVFRSDAVARLAAAIDEIDETQLRARFNPEEMMSLKIYPEIWDRQPDEDDTLGYCIENYAKLRRFLSGAAHDSLGIVLYLC